MAAISISSWNAVEVGPGCSVLTRIRRGATSVATARISPTCACLAEMYPQSPPKPIRPTTLDVMTMLPPSFITGSECLIMWNAPVTCTARVRLKISDG